MGNKREQFEQAVQKATTILLATAANGSVTMRHVSPVFYQGAILFFTAANSVKYRQLQANPHGCVAIDGFFAEASATFCGPTLTPENQALRDAYCAKFPDAFEENCAFGGRAAEFVILKPTRLTGWAFPDDIPTADGIPTEPFDLQLPEKELGEA